MSTLATLSGTELRLAGRELSVMLFSFVFPTLLMLVLAGVFAGDSGAIYGGASGTDYYLAAYLAIPVAATAFVGLPTMLATYRERGVLRRFAAFGVTPLRVMTAQTLACFVLAVLGSAVEMAVAAAVYGLPSSENIAAIVAFYLLGAATLLLLGAVLGLLARNARAASALGLMVFFPMWILGGGGPPTGVMTDTMRRIADVLPLSHMTAGLRGAWLAGDGFAAEHLLALGGWLAAGVVLLVLLLRRAVSR